MKLFNHQTQIVKDNPLWKGIFHGTGGGKTITALMLAEGETLVICPKQQKLDQTWENNLKKIGKHLNIKVVSKEEFRRDWKNYSGYTTVIVDECHTMLGVLPDVRTVKGVAVPKTSQLFDGLRQYLSVHPPKRMYLLSATPASKPMNVWAIGVLLGKPWDFFKFRDTFYFQRRIGFRYIWLPNNSNVLKQRLADNIKKLGYTGRLSDWFDVPEQTFKTVYVDLTPEQKGAIKELKSTNADPMAVRSKMRTIENGCEYTQKLVSYGRVDKMEKETKYYRSEKIDYILERAEEFPKMLIFANYIGQVEQIASQLTRRGYNVKTLTGETKNRETIIRSAEVEERCIVVAQSGISSGYELKSFDCVIFASKSYRYLDFVQGCGRVLRADALKKNLYIHLVCPGGMDEACHKAIESGKDFEERVFS